MFPPSNEPVTQMSNCGLMFMANVMYGLPLLSRVRSANSSEPSWKNPPSNTSLLVHVWPPSSEYATHTVWKACSMVRLQPVRTLSGSAASQATYTRPAWGPDGTILIPPGMVLQNDASEAIGSLITSTGSPNVLPPSDDALTQIWLGTKSW